MVVGDDHRAKEIRGIEGNNYRKSYFFHGEIHFVPGVITKITTKVLSPN